MAKRIKAIVCKRLTKAQGCQKQSNHNYNAIGIQDKGKAQDKFYLL